MHAISHRQPPQPLRKVQACRGIKVLQREYTCEALSDAETDTSSDSDNEHDNYVYFGGVMSLPRKRTKRKILQMSAPITIPLSTHRHVHQRSNKFDPSMFVQDDDDDSSVYNNTAFLCAQSQMNNDFRNRIQPPLNDIDAPDDQEIFELEL